MTFSKDSKDTHELKVVSNTPLKRAVMLNIKPLVAIDDAWLEDKLRSCLVNVHLTPVGDLLN